MKRREFLQAAVVGTIGVKPATPVLAQAERRGAGKAPELEDTIPMGTYLSQHDLVYEQAPREWEEGIPLGNGDLGALIWGDGAPLRITLDKYDVWETRNQDPTDPRYSYKVLRELIDAKKFEEARRVSEPHDPLKPAPTRLPLPRMELDLG